MNERTNEWSWNMHMQNECDELCNVCSVSLTLKSIPTVDIKLPDKKVPSRNRTSKHVLPTPESPSSITCWIWDGWTPAYSSHQTHTRISTVILMILCCATPRRSTPRRSVCICVLCFVPISFFHLLDFVVFSSFFFVSFMYTFLSFIVFHLSDSQHIFRYNILIFIFIDMFKCTEVDSIINI